MTNQPEVQVSRLLDERGLSSFQIKLLVWSFFIVLIDGYDIGAIAFAAPHLVRAWGVPPGALGPVFSASLVGILFGSAMFGWMGDRYGRKAALDRVEPVVRRVHLCGRLRDESRPDVLAAAVGRPRHRRRHSQRRRHQRRIRAAPAARDARDHRGRLRADRRRHSRLRGAASGADIRLADPVPDRRHRADRHRRCRAFRSAGVDQVHGAAREPARQDGNAHRRDQSRYQGAAQCTLRDRGREAVSRVSIRPIYSAKAWR